MPIRRVKLTFPPGLMTRPIIYEVGRRYNVVTNIRRAEVREKMGWAILELDGAENEIDQGLEWVGSIGVRVDPIVGDVIEG